MNSVQVIGMEDINRKLNEFEDKLARKHLRDSLRTVAMPIIKTVKSNIQGKIRKRTGILLRSIGSWFFKQTGSATIFVGPRTGKRSKYDAWYAHFLEFGTSGFGKRSQSWSSKLVTTKSGFTVKKKVGTTTGYGKKGGGIQARPFIRPAWDQHKSTITDNLGTELKRRTGI